MIKRWGMICLVVVLPWLVHAESVAPSTIPLLTISDQIITPTTAEYITHGIATAEQAKTPLLIELDTPGGLLTATQMIVQAIMNAHVPIIVYVAPNGARAASAGTFITLAAHVAAMAPSTRIGAAHPVTMGGESPSDNAPSEKKTTALKSASPMDDKILEDTVAWMKGIATQRQRNVTWAIETVTKSHSSTADEAFKAQAIDLIADSREALLASLDGRPIRIGQETWTLQTKAATVQAIPMTARQKLLQVLSNPNIAYILMMLGFYGLLFEITHPGGWVPGIAGGVCLILALYALHQLPTNYAGLAFILLAIVLFLAEIKVTSYGLLTVAGIACLFFGSMILIDSSAEFLQISLGVILPVVIATTLVALLLGTLAIRSMRARVSVGVESLIGRTAHAARGLHPRGTVTIDGEIWDAEADRDVAAGNDVEIVAVEGMRLKVRVQRI